jgi:Flp pilus assembly pilin Flp
MKTVLQFMRKQRGVTVIEYVMIGYLFCIFLIIGIETGGSRFNTNLFVRLLTHLTAARLGAISDAVGDVGSTNFV